MLKEISVLFTTEDLETIATSAANNCDNEAKVINHTTKIDDCSVEVLASICTVEDGNDSDFVDVISVTAVVDCNVVEHNIRYSDLSDLITSKLYQND